MKLHMVTPQSSFTGKATLESSQVCPVASPNDAVALGCHIISGSKQAWPLSRAASCVFPREALRSVPGHSEKLLWPQRGPLFRGSKEGWHLGEAHLVVCRQALPALPPRLALV